MSKTLKKNHYLTEYSSSFKWEDQNRNEPNIASLVRNDNINQSSKSSILNDRKIHQFRHKLKLALLEKLEKLESAYVLDDRETFEQSFLISSKASRRKSGQTKTKHVETHSPLTISESNGPKNHKYRKLKNKNGINFDGWRQELQRLRSMAMEFKHKNESTQIWWLNESLNISSDDENKYYENQDRFTRSITDKSEIKFSSSRVPVSSQRRTTVIPGRNQMISAKISTTEPSQSTFSKSSVSYQIAQATGYQSTTDELSSFNHDTDCRSVDPTYSKRKLSNSLSLNAINKEYEDVEVTKLNLADEAVQDAYSTIKRSPLQFYPPYQTEDFNKDTSSDSNIRNSTNYDTYRLD